METTLLVFPRDGSNGMVEEANVLDNKDGTKGNSPAPMEDNCCRDKQTKAQSNMKTSRDSRTGFRRLYNNTGVAFSAYLSNSVNHVGTGHTVIRL